MIRLAYANTLESLADLLARRLDEPESGAQNLFVPATVVVPNRGVETWVKMALSRRLGIAANLRCPTLFQFLRGLVPTHVGESDSATIHVVNKDVTRMALLSLLGDDGLLADPDLAPVARYLEPVRQDAELLDLRSFQLASLLAVLFEEYRFARPEMIAAWSQDIATLADGELAESERWQRALWRAVTGPGGVLERIGEAGDVQWAYLEQVFSDAATAKIATPSLPASVHIFGLSHVARAFHRVFAQLAGHCDVFVYAFNPCIEFWEDVEPRWKHPDLQPRFPGRGDDREAILAGQRHESPFAEALSPDSVENPFLQLWGRPGRETVRLLDALTQCDFDACFVDPCEGSSSALAHLQQDILLRAPPRGAAGPAPSLSLDDDSIQVMACPSVQREVETIAGSIWSLLRADAEAGSDPPLRFNDIAVLLPSSQRDAYLTRIQSVFAEAHGLPFNAVDLPAGAVSRIPEAIGLLLALPRGTFTREQLLTVVTHPNVAAAVGGDDVGEWVRWCDGLGVVHGADHTDHADTYIDADVFNWDQGLSRLVLGAVMDVDAPGAQLITLGDRWLAPYAGGAGDLESVASFVRAIRGLIASARRHRKGRWAISEWGQRFAATVARFVVPVEDADERVLDRCLHVFEELAEMPVVGPPVGYRVAYEMAAERLQRVEARRGHYLADGVVVSTLLPTRALPFRVAFVAGLGQGHFPAVDHRSPLDLRAGRPHPGDVTPRERDMYLFLETLVSTRDRIVFSYVARDDQTGEPLAASNVLDELLTVVQRGYLSADAFAACVQVRPLRRYDPAVVPTGDQAEPPDTPETYLPEALQEARSVALGRDLGSTHDTAGERIRRAMSTMDPDDAEALAHVLALPPLPPASAGLFGGSSSDTMTVTTTALRRFLESPLQGNARFLGLAGDSDYEDLVAHEDEAFHRDAGASAVLLRDVFAEALATPDGLDGLVLSELYARRVERLVAFGRYPVGPFGEAQRARDMTCLASWRHNVRLLDLPARGPFTRTLFGQGPPEFGPEWVGRPSGPTDLVEAVPPILIAPALDPARPNRGSDVALHGLTGLRFQGAPDDPPGVLLLLARDGVDPGDFLSGYIDHLALSAAGLGSERGLDVLGVSTGRLGASVWLTHFAPLAADAARSALEQLVTDLVQGPHDALLPIEAVCSALLVDPPLPLARSIRKLRDDHWGGGRFRHGPIRDVTRFEPPRDPEQVAHRRLDMFLSAVARRRPIGLAGGER